jgi:hypothetical protein
MKKLVLLLSLQRREKRGRGEREGARKGEKKRGSQRQQLHRGLDADDQHDDRRDQLHQRRYRGAWDAPLGAFFRVAFEVDPLTEFCVRINKGGKERDESEFFSERPEQRRKEREKMPKTSLILSSPSPQCKP